MKYEMNQGMDVMLAVSKNEVVHEIACSVWSAREEGTASHEGAECV